MFICNPCLHKYYENHESLFRSRGKCEICEGLYNCNEIKSSQLRPKQKENTNTEIKK